MGKLFITANLFILLFGNSSLTSHLAGAILTLSSLEDGCAVCSKHDSFTTPPFFHVGLAKIAVVTLSLLYFLFPFFLYSFFMKHFLCSLAVAALAWVSGTPTNAQAPVVTECLTLNQAHVAESRSQIAPAPTKQRATDARTTTCAPPYYIRINIHFLLKDDGTGNFNEGDDGGSAQALHWNIASEWLSAYGTNLPAGQPLPAVAPDANYNGYKFAEDVLNAASWHMRNNPPMQLGSAAGQTPPPTGIDYVLGGVYFHRDTNLAVYTPDVNYQYRYPDGVSSSAQFDTYGINKANEINLIIMGETTDPNITPSLPDPNGPPGATKPFGRWKNISGAANNLGYTANANWIKAGNIWRNHLLNRVRDANSIDPFSADQVGKMLNHEVGHLLYLIHPFQGGNGCTDTPLNLDAQGQPDPGAGNNVMDYGDQSALTSCQIGIAQNTITTYYTNYYTCQGCQPANAFFTLPETVYSGPNVRVICPELDGRASYAETSYSYSITPVDINNTPTGPSSTQSATGQVGIICLGSFNIPRFATEQRYAVELTVSNSCTSSSMTKYITAVRAGRRAAAAPDAEKKGDLVTAEPARLYPNPTTTAGFTLFSAAQPTELPTVRDNQGQSIRIEQVAQQRDETGWHTTYRFREQQSKLGLYSVDSTIDGKRTVQQLSVQAE